MISHKFRRIALLAWTAGALLAADVTGKWTAQMGGPEGDNRSIAFDFKQDGATLTGTVDGPGGEALAISNGKVDGNKISFTLTMGDGSTKITHEGTINGDQISLTTKMDDGGRGGPGGRGGDRPGGAGGPGGDGPPAMTLKRAQ